MAKFTEDLHLPMSNFLQLYPWSGGPPNSRRKLLWSPREHFKSSIASRGLPLWLLIHDRNTTIALVSAKHDNTKKWLRWIAATIQYNPVFRFAFPEIDVGPKWDQEEITVTRDIMDVDSDVQASISAYSIKGGLASQHHQHGILDDLLNEKTAYSQIERDRAIELYDHFESVLKGWWDSTMLLVGTPWPQYDVISHSMETEVKYGERIYWGIGARGGFEMSEILHDERYKDLNLTPNVEDRIREHGVIFHEECPEEKLQKLKRQNFLQYTYQYLCTKPEDEDNGFNVKLVRDYAQMMTNRLQCDCHSSHDHHLDRMIVVGICDPALTPDDRACESAVGVYAVDPTCGCRFILYEWGGRVETLDLVDKICQVTTEWSAYMRRFAIEDVHFQAALKAWIRERQSQGKIPLGVEIIGVKPKKRDKDLRIVGQQPHVAAGLWHKRPDMMLEEGKENLIWQIQVWPNQPKKRDRVDCWAYIEDALEGLSVFASREGASNSLKDMNKSRQVRDLAKMRQRSEAA